MKNEVSYLLAIPSYLVRKGIIYLLQRMPGQVIIHEINYAEDFEKNQSEMEFNAIIIENNSTENIDFKSIDSLPRLVIIDDKNISKTTGENTEHFLNVNCNKKEAFETMLDFHRKLLPKNESEDSNGLSVREKDVVRCIALGKTNKEMAVELFISLHTVITHRKNITGKLGIKTVAGLTVYALLNGLVKMEEIKE